MVMVINDVSRIRSYTATAGQTVFAVPFEFFDNDDLLIYNNNVLLTYNVSPSSAAEYSVTGAGVSGGGSITLGSPGAILNDAIVIVSDIAVDRLTDFPASGPFQIGSLNNELDALTIMIGQNETHFDRVLEAPAGEVLNTLPGAASRIKSVLAFDLTGQPYAQNIYTAIQDMGTEIFDDGTWTANAGVIDVDDGVWS